MTTNWHNTREPIDEKIDIILVNMAWLIENWGDYPGLSANDVSYLLCVGHNINKMKNYNHNTKDFTEPIFGLAMLEDDKYKKRILGSVFE